MSILTVNKSKNAVDVRFAEHKMIVVLEDGREMSIPLEWFERLRNASQSQLKNWRLIGKGEGIHWEDLDEDLLVENLFNE
jgi:hypothetical protein